MDPTQSVDSGQTAPLARVLRTAGNGTLAALANLPGADLTTLLLEVLRLRAGTSTAPDVLRQYRADRFVAPAAVAFRRLRDTRDGRRHELAGLRIATAPAGTSPP